jgi:hypothetical protein
MLCNEPIYCFPTLCEHSLLLIQQFTVLKMVKSRELVFNLESPCAHSPIQFSVLQLYYITASSTGITVQFDIYDEALIIQFFQCV